jgi:hypothetical protein
MKKLLIIASLLMATQATAAVTKNTIGCNSEELYDTLVTAQVNNDQRMIDHLSSTYQCYEFVNGLEYSNIGTTSFFTTVKKIRVWLPDGQHIDTYVSTAEGHNLNAGK